MSYEKQTWNKYDELKTEEENIENGAVVTDNRMNHMETGIGDNDANLASHLADKNNPHKVTAAQVGLDKVDNVKQASKVEFDSHTSDISNPHKVTATQIGLDKVDNIQQAAKTDFDSHVNNKANPHAVTASQVGAYSKTESDSKLTDLSNKVIANKGNLASGTDLDNVIDIGTYRIGGLTGGTDIINVPSERSGTTIYAYLTVSGTTTSVVQELIVYDSKTVSQIYSRSRSGSTPTFSPWSKTVMADNSGKVTVKDLEVTGTITSGTKNVLANGAYWMQAGQVITPSKSISDCANGWILHFTSYSSGMTGATKNGNNHFFYIPKEQVNIADVGTMFPLVVTDGTMTLKYLYLQNNKITGTSANESTNSKKYVLQNVLEY
ncbi:pyocin knob domain-containing protein [Lactococcus lactis]|uniref:pyocin knob domain-containing protein n=2 Tax=Lactococcus lactis TaxID=1358 RepID=UPI001F5C4477|nr:pyocin knob domain-containing protein [Lactococcus lactis]MCL9639924.1 pyocin knob domain-containing protein [Lactococcus lactis]